jgi:hypothetical protein
VLLNKTFRILLLFAFIHPLLSGQQILHSNPISLSLSSCDATLSNEWSSTGNPAGLAGIDRTSLAIMYERRFELSELSTKGGSIIVPTKYGVVSTSVYQYGFSEFNSTRLTLAYSRAFGKALMAAFQMNLWSDYIADAGHYNTLISDIGLIYNANKQISIGMHVFNPEQSSIQYPEYSIKIPSIISFGVGWKIISSTTFFAEIDKNFDADPDFSTAIEAQLSKAFIARLGYSINNNSVAFGVALNLNPIKINLGFSFQQPLGNISSVSTAWQLPSKNVQH